MLITLLSKVQIYLLKLKHVDRNVGNMCEVGFSLFHKKGHVSLYLLMDTLDKLILLLREWSVIIGCITITCEHSYKLFKVQVVSYHFIFYFGHLLKKSPCQRLIKTTRG